MPERSPIVRDPGLQAEVLEACRELLSRGLYPSAQLMVEMVAGRGWKTLLGVRKLLVESGRLAITVAPASPGPRPGRVYARPPGTRGLDHADHAEVADRARQLQLARMRKNHRGEPPDLSQHELDQVLPPVPSARTHKRIAGAEDHAR